MKTHSVRVTKASRGNSGMIDLTPDVADAVLESDVDQGSAVIFVVGSTAGITTIEYEPGLVRDLQAAFQKIAPDPIAYKHHERWNDDNGHSHVRASILEPSITVPVIEGKA